MEKFGRNYQVDIQTNDGSVLTIKPPFTIRFNIVRSVLSSANTCDFQILNLNQDHRYRVQKNINDYGNSRSMSFRAGYGNALSLAFTGNINQSYSIREGVDFTTYIDAFDGGFAFMNSVSNFSLAAGARNGDLIKALVGDMKGITLGAAGEIVDKTYSRGVSMKGQTKSLLDELSGGQFFIDNGKAYILADNEVLEPGGIAVIDSSTGLLGTPQREQTLLRFTMLFEPKLKMAQGVNLKSVTEPYLNGYYKVVEITHSGTISEAVSEQATTTVGLLAPFAGINFSTVQEAAS